MTEKEKRFRTSRSCKPTKKESGTEGGCSVSEEQTPHQSAALHMLKNTFKNAGLPSKGAPVAAGVGVAPPLGVGIGNTMGGVDIDRQYFRGFGDTQPIPNAEKMCVGDS